MLIELNYFFLAVLLRLIPTYLSNLFVSKIRSYFYGWLSRACYIADDTIEWLIWITIFVSYTFVRAIKLRE